MHLWHLTLDNFVRMAPEVSKVTIPICMIPMYSLDYIRRKGD